MWRVFKRIEFYFDGTARRVSTVVNSLKSVKIYFLFNFKGYLMFKFCDLELLTMSLSIHEFTAN